MEDHDEIHHVHLGHEVEESPREYMKLGGVIVGVLLASLFLAWARGFEFQRLMSDFMAVFFMTFATFKFVNIEEFAAAYSGYDIIAKRFRIWAYAFPFIEGMLGVAYLLLNDSAILNGVTMLITGIGSIGVWQELKNKSNIMCACLGTIIKLPLSRVSLIENVSMFVMAAVMLLI